MIVLVTGSTGFVGRHVVRALERRGHGVITDYKDWNPDAIIVLQWKGLPNYESRNHYENIPIVLDAVSNAADYGFNNITVASTCLETVANPPHYALAKLVLKNIVGKLPELKWARLWYLYGEGQRYECLLPRLQRAIARGDEEFHIIDGARDFMDVAEAAEHLCDIALQTEVTGTIDVCTGVAEPVIDFCRRHAGDSPIRLVADYPMPAYEPKSFHGDPTKLRSIHHDALT